VQLSVQQWLVQPGGGVQSCVQQWLVHPGGGVQSCVQQWLVHPGGGHVPVSWQSCDGGGGVQPVCAGLVLPMPWFRSHS
jgi:hypothetical protein